MRTPSFGATISNTSRGSLVGVVTNNYKTGGTGALVCNTESELCPTPPSGSPTSGHYMFCFLGTLPRTCTCTCTRYFPVLPRSIGASFVIKGGFNLVGSDHKEAVISGPLPPPRANGAILSSNLTTDGSQLVFRGPNCASFMVLRRGTHPPSWGAVRTVALKILKSGPPLACLLARNGSPSLNLPN